jgi:hypothetical protein
MKKILFTLCLAAALTGARGQIYIDSYRFGAAEDLLLLDSFTNADAAYSLRKLDKDYTGNVITVRRLNGDTSNIGFSGNYLDTVSLKSFCGETSSDTCWVRTWFDQSGNARNGRQTTDANQPQILRGGVIFYQNGEPALRFDGVDDFLPGPTSNILTASNPALSVFSVAQKSARTGTSNNAAALLAFGDLTPQRLYLIRAEINELIRVYIEANLLLVRTPNSASNWSSSQFLYSHIDNGTNLNAYQNNTQVLTNSTTTIGTFGADYGYNIGKTQEDATGHWIGSQQELIIYLSSQSTDRTTIQNNINRFYSIY